MQASKAKKNPNGVMNYNKKGIQKVAMAIQNTTERKEWLDATITTTASR